MEYLSGIVVERILCTGAKAMQKYSCAAVRREIHVANADNSVWTHATRKLTSSRKLAVVVT